MAVSFAAGISVVHDSRNIYLASVVCLLFAAGACLALGPDKLRKYLPLILLLPVLLLAGSCRTENTDISELKAFLDKKADCRVSGRVISISYGSDSAIILIDRAEALIKDKSYHSDGISIKLSESGRDICTGDLITCEGKLYPCLKATCDGQFDEDLYYTLKGVDAKMYTDKCTVTGQEDSSLKWVFALMQKLAEERLYLKEALYKSYPDEEYGILTALLAGDRTELSDEIKDIYSEGGIAHVLSISGLHIMLIGMGLYKLLLRLFGRLRLSIFSTLATIWLYIIMTGMAVSARRAGIMLTLMLIGRLFGRSYDGLSAAALAALLLLIRQPIYLYDSGFRLSFSAVAGVYCWNDVKAALNIRNKAVNYLAPGFFLNLFTLPVIMASYYRITPYSFAVNLIILPFMSAVIVSGGLSACFALLGSLFGAGSFMHGAFSLAASFAAGPSFFILKAFRWICELELKLPGSVMVTGAPDRRMLLIYCAAVLMALLLCICRKDLRYIAMLAACICIFFHPFDAPCTIEFLDVGQGKCIIARMDDRVVMADGGSSNISKVGEYRIIPYLKYHGISRIDSIMVTHSDKDHISGILELIETGFPEIGEICLNIKEGADSSVYAAAMEAGIPVRLLQAGDLGIYGEDYSMTCLAPELSEDYSDSNSASLVFWLSYKDFDCLLTGDSDSSSEALYSLYICEEAEVLDVAHHGSKSSSSALLLDKLKAQNAVVSCSKYNSYGHPASAVIERLQARKCGIYGTHQQGTVRIEYSGGDKYLIEYLV